MRQTAKSFSRYIIATVFVSAITFFVFSAVNNPTTTFADSEDTDIYAESDEHYVTIYDQSQKLSIRTNAKTVGEAISLSGIVLNSTDSVEPSLDSKIDMDNFYINIYRSYPVIISDGSVEKYVMTSSYDIRTIAASAGIPIYDGDEIEPYQNDKFLETGIAAAYRIIRNGGQTLTVHEEIPFEEQIVKDYKIGVGNSEILQLGEVGSRTLIYQVLYVDGVEISRELISEVVDKAPVARIVAKGVSWIEMNPLTAQKGRNYYTYQKADGTIVERQETFYDLNMQKIMEYARGWEGCSHTGHYSVRSDGVKIDDDGYVLVAAELSLYPRCSVVETSLGPGKIYDTGSFALSNPEQFDIATDWTNRNEK